MRFPAGQLGNSGSAQSPVFFCLAQTFCTSRFAIYLESNNVQAIALPFSPHSNGTRPLWRARKTLPDDCDVIAMSAQLVPPLELPDCFLAPVVPPVVLSLSVDSGRQ
ncbi:hypothetical protein FJTKL_09496 [Diaporthe vaccinii]|uniref:Uncharacterized protein n=1 Tax=Diaporthe vaccinii TaxID=105482 RepID=A0ABR4FCY5_9PEZI